MIVPWIEDGIAAGESIVIAYDERKSALLRSWLSDPSGVTSVPAGGHYASPARAISTWHRTYRDLLDRGAPRVRAAGDVPHAGSAEGYVGWDRYEMALNSALAGLPVWNRCLYDAATTPDVVRDMVERTHPGLLGASGEGSANERCQDSVTFTGLPADADPITETTPPVVELLDPAPAEARWLLARAGRGILDEDVLDELIVGVSEAVTNAHRHGGAARALRVWSAPGRVVAHVHDTGGGIADPLVGLLPADPGDDGAALGLWIVHHLDVAVRMLPRPDGFTVQISATNGDAAVA